MKIKLDENLVASHQRFLLNNGWDTARTHEEGLSGASDERVWQRVCEEGRFLITLDLGFSDIRRFPPGTHPGILLIRARRKDRGAVMGVLQRVLAEGILSTLSGCLSVADETRTRVRRPRRT
ncbi:MAG: DUF5615 family PIN-like protein [Planctomycetes bacterium]|nr:DUF5615 family PIN-like protein [Planctomycetota bacterium]